MNIKDTIKEDKKIPLFENEENKSKNIMTYDLIRSVFKDKYKKSEIIEKLRPFFALKVIPNREIEKIYSSVEKIDPEKIDLLEEFRYEEEKFDSKDVFETDSKSLGLSKFDLDLSAKIFGHKNSFEYENIDKKINNDSSKSIKIHCIHSIVISLFRIVIDFKEIKLAKQVYEDFNIIKNTIASEKKMLLEELIDKFGLYIPLELLIGGRINISFVANNENEKKEIYSLLEDKINAELNGGLSWLSVGMIFNKEEKDLKNKITISKVGILNFGVGLTRQIAVFLISYIYL